MCCSSRIVTIPNCGHLPQEERPEEFMRTVEDFVKANPAASAKMAQGIEDAESAVRRETDRGKWG